MWGYFLSSITFKMSKYDLHHLKLYIMAMQIKSDLRDTWIMDIIRFYYIVWENKHETRYHHVDFLSVWYLLTGPSHNSISYTHYSILYFSLSPSFSLSLSLSLSHTLSYGTYLNTSNICLDLHKLNRSTSLR